MINIEELKPQIIKALMPLKPDKIILFGSYAYGKPDDDSDIDLFIIKNNEDYNKREYKLNLRKEIRQLISKYKVGFDFIVASEKFVRQRDDYFYKNDILKNGKIIYE